MAILIAGITQSANASSQFLRTISEAISCSVRSSAITVAVRSAAILVILAVAGRFSGTKGKQKARQKLLPDLCGVRNYRIRGSTRILNSSVMNALSVVSRMCSDDEIAGNWFDLMALEYSK